MNRCGRIPDIQRALALCQDSADYSPGGLVERCDIGHRGLEVLKTGFSMYHSVKKESCKEADAKFSMSNAEMVDQLRSMGRSDSFIQRFLAQKASEAHDECAAFFEKEECVNMALPIVSERLEGFRARLRQPRAHP